jgi:hypothetical protein
MKTIQIEILIQSWLNNKITFMDAIFPLFFSIESFYIIREWMFKVLEGKMSIQTITDLIVSYTEKESKKFWGE